MGSLRKRCAAPTSIGPGNPRSAFCTSWERRSSGMTELSALAGSERWAACENDAQLRPPSAPGTHEVHSALRGEEEQRNDRALGLGRERRMGSLRRRRAACFYCLLSHSATVCGMLIPRASVLDMAPASCGLSPKPSSIVILAAPIVDCTQSLYPPASRLSVLEME